MSSENKRVKVGTRAWFRERAKEMYEDEGTLEVDEGAKVSISEDQSGPTGAYVQAWVWVPLPDGE